LVDRERIAQRLARLDGLLARLEEVHAAGLDAYLADEGRRLMTERALLLAQQIVIDVASQAVAERGLTPPATYADVFGVLAAGGLLDDRLAATLADAARQRNLLVHLDLEVDDRLVFAALGRLDAFRRFAAAAIGW
jgi:uncharacterized protein YutE (UPF0331/DUF86 family)